MQINHWKNWTCNSGTIRTEHRKKEFKIQRVRRGFLNKISVSQDKMSKINNRDFFLNDSFVGLER